MKPRSYALSQKILFIAFFAFIILFTSNVKPVCSFPTSRQFVDGCNATRILCLSKKMGNTLDEVRHSIGELILSSSTISNAGHYVLGRPIESPIIIDSDDVYLDLNGYEVCATGSAIIINEDKKNILIKNGSLVGAECCEFTCSEGSLINASGILVKEGASLIQIEGLSILGFAQGILFDGTVTGTIESCDVQNTILYCNNKGIVLNYTIKSTFDSNEALNCYESGFELYKSQFNCFDKCRAIETKNNTATKHAAGFVSTSGNCNLFYECVSNGSEKTSSNFGYNAIGFLLKGTSSQAGETNTEIVTCIANKGATTENANVYGAHLDAVLKGTDPLGTVAYTHATDKPINTVAWSPESRFMAIGQDYVATDSSLKILSLYSSALSVYAKAYPNDQNVLAAAWDPKGTYLAVGTASDGSSGSEFFIYEFDPDSPATSFLTTVTSFDIGAAVNSIEWSPDGKAIAFGTDSGATAEEIQIWGFDASTSEISTYTVSSVNTGANVTGVAFSPDGKYLAAVYSDTVDIYRFRCLATDSLTLQASESGSGEAYGGNLNGVDWSPIACCSKYFVAVCGEAGTSVNMQVLTYDGNTTLASFETDYTLSTTVTANCITWSPNGKYLLTGGERALGYSTEVFSFDASATAGSRTATQDKGAQPYNANSCVWSPSGRYVISAGDDSSTGGTASVYETSNVPLRCVIKYSELLNNTGGLCGIGIEASSGENLIIKNIGYENNINFSAGVFNKFADGLNGNPTLIENISVPPYEN